MFKFITKTLFCLLLINSNNAINIKNFKYSRIITMYNDIDNVNQNKSFNNQIYNNKIYKLPKNVRVNYKIAKKKSNRLIYDKLNLILKNQNEIIDKTVSFISDNMVNEILYLLKFYNLSNDHINSYIYIIFYEMVWVGYKILRINTNKNFDISNEDSQLLGQQLLINILIYIFVKNLFINTFVYTLNN